MGEPIGVEASLHVALEHAGAHAVEAVVAEDPLEQRRLARRPARSSGSRPSRRARSKSSRLARAIVLLASSASSTTRTFTRCTVPPRPRSTPLPARSPSTTSTVRAAARRAAERGNVDRPTPSRSPRSAAAPATSSCSSRAPSQTVSRDDDPEVEVQRVGHDLAQRARRAAARRVTAPPGGMADGRVDDRRADRELMHTPRSRVGRSSAIVSRTSVSARADGRLDGGREPVAHVVDLARLAADDDDLARPAAGGVDEAQHRVRVHARAGRSSRRPRSIPRTPRAGARSRTACPGSLALAAGVDEDQRVVAAHHLVGEVEAARAEVHHRHARGHARRASSRRATSPPNASSCSQALPTPATRICFSRRARSRQDLHLGGLEVQVAADVAHQLAAGVVVDRDAEMHGVVVVDVDALDGRGAPGRAGGPGRVPPSARRRTRAAAAGTSRRRPSPRPRRAWPSRAARARAPGRSSSRARAARGCPRGVAATARSTIARTAGSCSAICVALVVAERQHMQQQRLLDLGGVEQVAAALGRELRMVGEHDRRAQQRVVVVASRAPGTCSPLRTPSPRRRRARAGRSARGSARRRSAPTTCVESRLEPSAAARSRPRRRRPASCCARTSSRARGRSSKRCAAMRIRPVTPSKANSVTAPSSSSAASGVAGSATRRSTPSWRSPLGCRKRTVERQRRLVGPVDDRPASGSGRTSSGCPARTRAGRRSRTASASRSWSRPACRGRARSPPRAGW